MLHPVRSNCYCISASQVNVQENVRDLQVSSQGGDITCTLPPTLGSVAAIIEPISQATFGEGLTYEVSLCPVAAAFLQGPASNIKI